MEWRDAQRGGSSIMLLNGVSTAPDELKGFYAVIPSRYEHGRPVYQQLGVAAPNYIYATTEWYSSIEMWAVGPPISLFGTFFCPVQNFASPHQNPKLGGVGGGGRAVTTLIHQQALDCSALPTSLQNSNRDPVK